MTQRNETHDEYIASIFNAIYPPTPSRVFYNDEHEIFLVVADDHVFIFHVSSDDDNFDFIDMNDPSIRVSFPIPTA